MLDKNNRKCYNCFVKSNSLEDLPSLCEIDRMPRTLLKRMMHSFESPVALPGFLL